MTMAAEAADKRARDAERSAGGLAALQARSAPHSKLLHPSVHNHKLARTLLCYEFLQPLFAAVCRRTTWLATCSYAHEIIY